MTFEPGQLVYLNEWKVATARRRDHGLGLVIEVYLMGAVCMLGVLWSGPEPVRRVTFEEAWFFVQVDT